MSEKEKQRKGVFPVNNKECFALSHFNLSVSSTVKVANAANYHITI